MFSQTAEYALRAVVYLAERPGKRCTTRSIAEVTQVPPGYLAKVMKSLAQAGVVIGQRGLNGGFSLARKPEEISVFEILQVIDPLKRIRECPLNLKEHADQMCPLHTELDRTLAEIEATFKESSIQDMLRRPTFCEAGNSTAGNKEG